MKRTKLRGGVKSPSTLPTYKERNNEEYLRRHKRRLESFKTRRQEQKFSLVSGLESFGRVYAMINVGRRRMVFYRSASGFLWHLAIMNKGLMYKSPEHYTGTLLASWSLQACLNAQTQEFFVFSDDEFPQDYQDAMKLENFGDSLFQTLMTNNPCFNGTSRTTPFELINSAFPCGSIESPHDGTSFTDNVLALLHQVYTDAQIAGFDKAFRQEYLQLDFVCSFMRQTIDAFMRNLFEIDHTFLVKQALPEFVTSFGTTSITCCRIMEKANQRLYNVFVSHTAPIGGPAYEYVVLVQQVRQPTELDEQCANLQLMYCFVPAGQYTCKALEYKRLVGQKRTLHFNQEDEHDESYLYVGRYLHGIFPSERPEDPLVVREDDDFMDGIRRPVIQRPRGGLRDE